MMTNQDATANIAANVRRLLTDRGWSQAELVRRTGDAPITISRVVRGKNLSSAAVLARIAEAFDVSVDRLLGPPPEKNTVNSRIFPKLA